MSLASTKNKCERREMRSMPNLVKLLYVSSLECYNRVQCFELTTSIIEFSIVIAHVLKFRQFYNTIGMLYDHCYKCKIFSIITNVPLQQHF